MFQYLLTPPDRLPEAEAFRLPPVHLAWHIGPDGNLHGVPGSGACRGGLMLAGTAAAPGDGPADRAVRDILALCRDRGFRGVVLDPEEEPSPFLARLIRGLDRGLERDGRGFFLPERCAAFSRRAFLFLSPAVSGGSLRRRLEQAAEAYGARRLVLSLERSAEDFPLPSPVGEGRKLTREELGSLLRRLGGKPQFSPDLCACTLPYLDRQSRPRLLLFDNADSLRRKRDLARELGIGRFFLLYPQLEDILPSLLS